MSEVPVIPLVDKGLGNSTYLVDLGDGRAMAVDPSRDLRAVDAAATEHGLRVVYSAETHLHADFVSGSVQLAANGAQVLASAAGGRSFAHRGLADEDEVDLGGLTLKALTTPGHTAEHLSYLLLDGTTSLGLFTGGSLLVGAAARTDLAGAERTSSIGAEKATNPYLAAPDEDAFVAKLLTSLGSYPPYFDRLGEVNRRGPALLDAEPALTALSPAAVQSLRQSGAEIIDVRTYQAYADAHIPGSLSIPLREVFATWLGWLLPSPATPLVIVRDPDQDPKEVLWQARKIGYEQLAGELADGLAAWTAAGHPVASTPVTTPAAADPTTVIDVRQAEEFNPGHLPGVVNIELGALSQNYAALSGHDVVVMCGHGERAATAASVLERAGVTDVKILPGGPQNWADAGPGRTLQVNP